jgi:hypothetical protein
LGGKEGSPELTRQDSPAVICVETLTPKDVRRRTGFDDIIQLLSYVAVVCGGDVGLMTLRQSRMTWLEEWVFYLEKAYGRSRIRAEDLADDYCIGLKTAR